MEKTWTDHIKKPISDWISRRCVDDRYGSVAASELFRAFAADHPRTCTADTGVSQRALTVVLTKLGYGHTRHGKRGRIWLGLRLK